VVVYVWCVWVGVWWCGCNTVSSRISSLIMSCLSMIVNALNNGDQNSTVELDQPIT
jgi:hypothetical protein